MLPEQLPFDIQPSVLGSLSVSISTSQRYPFIVFVCFSIVCMCWLVLVFKKRLTVPVFVEPDQLPPDLIWAEYCQHLVDAVPVGYWSLPVL